MRIDKFFDTKNTEPLIIAELSGNHNNSIKIAKKIISEVSKSGAQMIKFQTFSLDEMTFNLKKNIFKITNRNNPWFGKYYYDLYKKSFLPFDKIQELFNFSKKKRLLPFSSVFDLKSLEFLEKINCKVYKISSFENTDHELIKNVAQTKKPIIISSGLATKKEMDMAINLIKKFGNSKIILLKCTSNYPASHNDLNLKTILDMKKRYKINIGFSDHTIGDVAAISAIAQGATAIEKHVCLNRQIGIDSKFSLEVKNLKKFVNSCRDANLTSGKIFYGPTKKELKLSRGSRSLYYKEDLKKGSTIKKKHFKRCRPNKGIKIYNMEKIISKKLRKSVRHGDPVRLNHFYWSTLKFFSVHK